MPCARKAQTGVASARVMIRVGAPPSVDDEEEARAFVEDFVMSLPALVSALRDRRNELLVAFIRKGVLFVQEFYSRHQTTEADPHFADVVSAIAREKLDLAVQCAEALQQRWGVVGVSRSPFSDSALPFVLAGVMTACCCAAALVLGLASSTAGYIKAAICLISVAGACSLVAARLFWKQRGACLRSLEGSSMMLQELIATGAKPGVPNPLFGAHFVDEVPFEEGNFLVDPVEVPHKGVEAILLQTDDDEGTLTIRTKGLAQVSVSLSALNKHILVVVTDLGGKVVYWSDGASMICGFTAKDAEGKHINSFIFGEKSQQIFERMVDAATNGVDPSPKLISVANLAFGSVPVKAAVVLARDHADDIANGFVLIASSQESEAVRGLAQFHQYFVAELQQAIPRDDAKRNAVNSLHWKTLLDLSDAARDWAPVLVQGVLSDVVKDRHRQCDVRVSPDVPELIVCDQSVVTRMLIQTLQALEGKVRIQVTQRRVTDSVQQLQFQCFHHAPGSGWRDRLGQIPVEIGCDLSVFDNVVKLSFPCLNEGGSGAPRDVLAAKQKADGGGAQNSVPPMTILLLERNAVYRHNISTIAWALGHSLRVVDSLAKAVKSVNDSSVDLGCAIVDFDTRDVDKLLEALVRHKVFAICTTEATEAPAGIRGNFVTKPVVRAALEAQFERAAASIRERRKVDEEIVKQREVFGKVRNSPWTRGRKLGRGAFADVFEATSTLTGGKMAVKMIRLVGGFAERVKELMNEIEILCSLSHPNIIHYFYCERAETTINLFMELADEGSLADLLAVQPRLTEDQVAVVTKQLLLAVNYLHDQGIIHRDIKPGNMLISKGKMKLSDFGTATNSVISEGTQGTVFYMAPEVVDGDSYGKECDIWSIGCVVCECLGIKRPPRHNGLVGFGAPTAFPTDVSSSARDFISLCLQDDPGERPTAGTLLLHDFIVVSRSDASVILGAAELAHSWGHAIGETITNTPGSTHGGDAPGDLSVSSTESHASW